MLRRGSQNLTAGVELSRARQRRGLSIEQISERTKIPVELLTAIEQARYDELWDESLRAYLRLFAQEVGLDPRDVSERYIAQLQDWSPLEEFADESGQPDPPFGAGSEPDEPFIDELPAEAAGQVPQALAHSPAGALAQQQQREADDRWRPLLAAAARASARPVPYGAVLMVALVTLTTGFWAFTSLQKRADGSGAADAGANATRTLRETRQAPSRAPDHTPQSEERTIAKGAESPANLPSRAENLSGWWVVTNRIEQSNLDSFKDLTLDFRLQLDQNGNRVRGQGVKWKENGRTIGARARRPISVDGTIEEGRLALRFTEQGVRRTSHGSFEMQLAEDGSLRGRFSSDAAQSSGSAQAVRMQ
jgi:hypothetical protein